MSHVLLWSKRQNALHIEPVETMISSNRRAYRDNRSCDYIVLALGPIEEMHKTADACRGTLMGRLEQEEREGQERMQRMVETRAACDKLLGRV